MLDQLLTLGIAWELLVQQECLQGPNKVVPLLSLDQMFCVPVDSSDDIPRQVVSWHLGSLFVADLKVVTTHGFLQAIQGFRVNLAKLLQRFMVGVQDEVPSPQVCIEMIHTPDSSLHL